MRWGIAALLLLAACAGAREAAAPGGDAQDAGDAGEDAAVADAGDAGHDAGIADAGQDAGAVDAGTDAGTNPLVIARPYVLHLPSGWDQVTPAPLLILFHGY